MRNLDLFTILSDNDKLKTLDLSKKEDLEELITYVNDLKKNSLWTNGLFKEICGDLVESMLNDIIKEAQEEYALTHKDDVVCASKQLRPSEKLDNEKIKSQINGLVEEYWKEQIEPNSTFNEEQKKSVLDGLYEFGCWIYSR